jgi:hypothetical protein
MKITLALILSIFVAFGMVALGFTIYQISTERTRLTGELETKSREAVESIVRSDSIFFKQISHKRFENYADSITKRYNLTGIAVYFRNDSIISSNSISNLVPQSLKYIPLSLYTKTSLGVLISASGEKTYQYIKPVKRADNSGTAIIIYTDAGYIDKFIENIWIRNLTKWLIQAFLVSLILVLIMRWGVFSQVNKIALWVRAVRTGNTDQIEKQKHVKFLAPLHNEIEHIAKAMHEAKTNAAEEARLRTSAEAIWTPERLKVEVENLLQKRKMIVVSNREPYMHIHDGKEIKCIVPASGMITAMEPILKACSGLWIASGTGDADKETVDKNGKLAVPPEEPKYTLKRLWLTKEEEDHFYYGFSNEGLWPLCHIAHTRPTFRIEDWNYYKKVNEDFARAILKETSDEERPFILIQDFHFALLPELIKRDKPKAKLAIFWHIPWPNPESFGICPWQREILEGMLGADLIGFHTQYHCNHFIETVNSALESRVSWEDFSIKIGGRTTLVKPFPISISFTLKDYDDISPKISASSLLLRHGVSAKFIGIGVDRIDYTKGLIENFYFCSGRRTQQDFFKKLF